jgi:hypothetical protein
VARIIYLLRDLSALVKACIKYFDAIDPGCLGVRSWKTEQSDDKRNSNSQHHRSPIDSRCMRLAHTAAASTEE